MMQRNLATAFALAFLAGLSTSVNAASPPIAVPLDSFISRHVDTLAEMSRQVTLDPVVRRRLARHFHTSGPAMVRYIHDNLVLKNLPKTRRCQVYCVSRSGHEYTINARLLQGTPVFVLRTTGEPILKLACGNPMVSALPPVVKRAGSEESLPSMAAVAKPVPAKPSTSAPKLMPMSSKLPVIVHLGGKSTLSLMPLAVTKVAGGLYELPASRNRFPLGFLAGLPLLAGLATHNGGNNAGNVGVGIGTGTGTNTRGSSGNNSGGSSDVTPVPEPSPFASFAIGGVGLVILLAGARRRRKTNS